MRKYTLRLVGALAALVLGCGQETRSFSWEGLRYTATKAGELEEVKREQDGEILFKEPNGRSAIMEGICMGSLGYALPIIATIESLENLSEKVPSYSGENGQLKWDKSYREALEEYKKAQMENKQPRREQLGG